MSNAGRISVVGAVATFLASLALLPAHDDAGWLWMGAGATILVVLVGHILRHIRTPRLLIPPVQLAGLLWAFLLIVARDDLHYGFLPSTEALRSLALDINAGLAVIVRYSAPLPYDGNAILVTALGIGLVAVTVDALAATARLTPWAGLPILLLYSIPATTVSGGMSAIAFIPTAIGYIGLLMVESRGRINQWGRVLGVSDRFTQSVEGTATSSFGKTGRRVGAAAICSAVVIPLFIPTLPSSLLAQGQGSGFGTGGGQTIRIDNPIVNLRRDLRRPDNFKLMTYTTNADNPEYLRLAVLDEFDGEQWRPTSRDVPRDQQVDDEVPHPPGLSDEVERTEVTSRIVIDEVLRSKRLPLPYPYTDVEVDGDWRYDNDTHDVVVGPDEDSDATAGLRYEVTSLALNLDRDALRSVGAPPPEISERYTALPDDIPDSVTNLAAEVVGDAESAYDKAAELQAWFRSEFIYSTMPEPGHGGSHLIDFLEDKRGYCEQFAATMAIMARSMGIPARVAVGYMPGSNVGDSTWEVKVHDAHAWPELYFEGFGWIRFEPTPAQQTGSPPTWTEATTAPAPVPTESGLPTEDGQRTAAPQPQPGDPRVQPELDPNNPTAGLGGGGDDDRFDPRPLLFAGGILLVFALPALLRPLIRRTRLSEHSRPGARAEAAWRELTDIARDLGLRWDGAATPRSTATALGARLPQRQRRALDEITRSVERARYSPEPGAEGHLPQAVHTVRRALTAGASRRRRLLALLMPPSILIRLGRLGRAVAWSLDGLEILGSRVGQRLSRSGT